MCNIIAKDERQKIIKPIIHSDHVVFYAHSHTASPRAYAQAYASPHQHWWF